jgi:hypothetical protein
MPYSWSDWYPSSSAPFKKNDKKKLIRTIAILLNADEDLDFLLKLNKEDLTVLAEVCIREIVDRSDDENSQ